MGIRPKDEVAIPILCQEVANSFPSGSFAAILGSRLIAQGSTRIGLSDLEVLAAGNVTHSVRLRRKERKIEQLLLLWIWKKNCALAV